MAGEDDTSALARREELFRASFEQAAVGMAHKSLDGRLVRVNAKLCEILGYERTELEGRPVAAMSLPEEAPKTAEAMRALGAGEVSTYSVDKPYFRKDGSLVWMHLTTTPARDIEGRIRYFNCVYEEIGARRAAEAANQRSLSLLQATIESTADGILVVDASGRIARHNRQFAAMWRIPEPVLASGSDDEAIASVLAQLVDPGAFVAKVRDLYAHPEAESFDELQFKDGRVFERYSKPQRLGGSTVGRVWSFRDVTARRRAEIDLRKSEEQLRQSQKMEAVGRLAGGVAHDFNNLLLVITGCVDVARHGIADHQRVLDVLAQIEGAAHRAAGLTRQLLAFSRQQVLEPRVVDVNGLVADTVAMLGRVIGEDIAIETSLDPRAYQVLLDPGQVAQVLMNLAVNARDAMPSGGKLAIATCNVELDANAAPLGVAPGLYVRIVVSDTGHGMDETTQARAFEPFFTTKAHGTGLGLSTVYGIVKQSGGAVSVRSEVGRGTTVDVFFPRATTPLRSDSSAPRIAVARGHETVLLVEDEAAVRKVVRLLLTANGYTVLSATGPDEAIQLATKHAGEIDVLLTDVVMPGMNGRELAERVAKLSPAAKVVFMSGYASGALPGGTLAADVAFLQKPFTEGALVAKLRSALGR